MSRAPMPAGRQLSSIRKAHIACSYSSNGNASKTSDHAVMSPISGCIMSARLPIGSGYIDTQRHLLGLSVAIGRCSAHSAVLCPKNSGLHKWVGQRSLSVSTDCGSLIKSVQGGLFYFVRASGNDPGFGNMGALVHSTLKLRSMLGRKFAPFMVPKD